jgi:hypothetical protein
LRLYYQEAEREHENIEFKLVGSATQFAERRAPLAEDMAAHVVVHGCCTDARTNSLEAVLPPAAADGNAVQH